MRSRFQSISRSRAVSALATLVIGVACASDARAQARDAVEEMERRAAEQRVQDRLDRFVEDTYEFFELSGELVSFRVHPNMTETELETLSERAEEVEDQAGRLISFVRTVAPFVSGKTEGLWIVFDPPTADTPLEQRLTLILALVNRLSPKLDQITTQLLGEARPTVSVEDLQLEASAPYFVVGGLEELQAMTRDLRQAL